MTTDLARDLTAVREATERLLTAVRGLDDAAVAEPSRLPGWTRGHVLTHLARNADALVNVLVSARTGEHIPMYPDERARDAAIEDGAGRPLAVQLDDLERSSSAFNDAAAALHSGDWFRTVELRGGATGLAAEMPFRRLAEVELHHVDLGIGREIADLPGFFTDGLLAQVAGERFAGREDVPALIVAASGAHGGREWRTGRPGGDPLRVSGSPAALLGWLTGREAGTGLDAGGSPLPSLPPLG
ncbi:maleylpyruvate isomerase family mycothiol-dependent enzyme [Streptomyces sp. WAC 00631]|uniref:maleylpyruvate isomerase family mycothiol-dependent enzyme n=1 Tax=Streptomyces sp. WAC 00631 TaxID=2203201 RepID=UPI000F7872F3|nr:maleylpyruvate isomerase family mycothiol-dependent enzyme [Streptomyces sp. WAC 00631]MCC5034451.1 maleylpyruvate isomerase family mycothiol-dependent enzyme [Streptomyces sp. WAC 00631]